MILAAAACAEDPRQPPPPELALAWQCQRWNALPEAGGLLDQPAGLVQRMTGVDNVFRIWRDFIHAPNMSAWKARNPDGWLVVAEVLKRRG
jgi:hypothetical protein